MNLTNLRQNLLGKHIQIAGSAHETTDLEVLRYSHKLVRYITSELLRNGAKLIVATGSEDIVNPGKPSWDTALYYDWNVLEALGDYINSRHSNNLLAEGPLAVIITSEKAESDIPDNRRGLWDQLIEKQAIYLERLRPGWNAGMFRREQEAKYGDGLIIIGGGEGVEHSSELYINNGKPVIPIDLPINPRYGDGRGGAPEISRLAISNPIEYLGPINNGTTRLLSIATKAGSVSVEQIVPKILQLLADAVVISVEEEEKTEKRFPKSVCCTW